MRDSEERIVYCLAEHANFNDDEVGSIIPVFEQTVDGLKKVEPDVFVNNGKIHVTKGYHKVFQNQPAGQFFKVTATVSLSWNPENAHDGISKYVTYDKNSVIAKPFTICDVVEGQYPNPTSSHGLQCNVSYIPADGFFIDCMSPDNDDVIVGPFNVVRESIRNNDGSYVFNYKALDRPVSGELQKINGIPHSCLVFEKKLIASGVLVRSNKKEYLINLNLLPEPKVIDVSTNDQILKWASKLLRVSGSDLGRDLSVVRNSFEQLPTDLDIPKDIYEYKKNRLSLIPDKIAMLEGFDQLLSGYMKSTEGKNSIKQHVDAHRDSLLEAYYSEALESELERAKKTGTEKSLELKKDIRDLNTEKEELEKIVKEIRESELGIERDNLAAEVSELRKEKSIVGEVDRLEVRKELLSEDLGKITTQHNDATSLLRQVQAKINQTQETHKKNLITLKMELEAISGHVKTDENLKADIKISDEFYKIVGSDEVEKRKDVIEKIVSLLTDRGRVVGFDDIAILLTCISQNLIVSLAGKPGVGKTSTVSELADVLGLIEDNKYAHIQVQRGWSSDRDIIGFFNKLSKCYEPDRFGLYKLINALQDAPHDGQLAVALLDEANLSPVEHYWSLFMGACDDSKSFSTQGESLSLPSGLRFMATVNYDRTTEPLSTRFLDRSPVIYLDNRKSNASPGDIRNSGNELFRLSFSDMSSLFGNSDGRKFTRDEQRIIDDIVQEHTFLPVNYRKYNAIANFTEVLRDVVAGDQSEALKAIDYAILVYVLPAISGQGKDYKSYVMEFSDYLHQQGLLQSRRRLDQIVSNARFDSYSYFS